MTNQTQQKLLIINQLAEKAAQQLGLILLEVRLGQQGKNKSLEVSIYRKDPPIGFTDCEQMSRTLDGLLESEEAKGSEYIGGPYLLEVVSAGIERQLTKPFEFKVFAGSKVRIIAKEKIASLGAEFAGILLGGDEQAINIGQPYPFCKQEGKNQAKKLVKKIDKNSYSQMNELTLALKQIYRIFLCPDLSEQVKTAVH